MNKVEQEVIFLKAIKELVDTMVNREILDVLGTDPDCSIMFHMMTNSQYFNIILVGFLSRTDNRVGVLVEQNSYLGALNEISADPAFDVDNSVSLLANTTRAFRDWLEIEFCFETWFPTLNKAIAVKTTRIVFLKMCGNISKHNFLRSIGVAEELRNIIIQSGESINIEDAVLALHDFYSNYHDNIFNYHFSAIVEFLNDIRWGIYEYLQPQFRKSYYPIHGEPPGYGFNYPTDITAPTAKTFFWDLMNEVRDKPYMPRFQVTKWLKLRY